MLLQDIHSSSSNSRERVKPEATNVSKRTLIKGGIVISVDSTIGDLRQGDVLIEGAAIVEVAPSIAASDCEVVDAAGMIVMPGLVDSHRHLWQTLMRADSGDFVQGDLFNRQWPRVAAPCRPDDIYAAVLAGAADALNSGVTSVLDWCHVVNTPEHAEENVRALREAGIRARFLYGNTMGPDRAARETAADRWAHARRMYDRDFSGVDDLVDLGLAVPGPNRTDMAITAADASFARELGIPFAMHIGIPEGPEPKRGIRRLAAAGLLGPDINFAHCCDTSDEELSLMADAGSVATACPTLELAFGMGTPVTGRLRDAGIRPAVGVDSVNTTGGDMFDELRVGLLAERGRRAQALFAGGHAAETTEQLRFTTREALECGTINGAHAMWLGDTVGSLTPGKRADIILLRATDLNLAPVNDAVSAIVFGANSGNVDTVMVDGTFVKRGGKLLTIDVDRVRRLLAEARDRAYAYDDYPGMRPPAGVTARA